MRRCMRTVVGMLAAVALAATVVPIATARAQANAARSGSGGGSTTKTVTTAYPVEVSFADRNGDAVTSDGGGPYRDGQQGVSAYMQVDTTTTGSVVTKRTGKLVVSIGASRGKIVRKINVNYTNPVDTPCMSASSAPTGTTTAGYLQVLGRISLMGVGTIRASGGNFMIAQANVFRFRDPNLVNYPDNCSSTFVMTRDTATTWTVTTDHDPTVQYYDVNGVPVFNVGDTSQFENETGSPFYGNYKMPFRMTITCLSATNCSPVGS